jgi:molecular chaperone GrpE
VSRARRKQLREEDEEVTDHTEDATTPDDLSSAVLDELSSSANGESGLEAVEEGPATPRQALEALREERDELAEQLLRRRAEFENFRRRVERDRHSAAQEALAAIFRELLGTVDNLERALSSAAGGEDELRTGVELTHRELVGLLESHDVVPVDPLGEPFDPAVQQALLHEPVPGLEEGEVAEVFRKGYLFGERLLRPALVKVAKGDDPEDGREGGGEDEGS